jgi:hypothetical protein
MVDGLFTSMVGDLSRYLGVTSIFPEVSEFITMERSLKLINAQLGRAVTDTSKLGVVATKTYKDYAVKVSNSSKELHLLNYRVETLQHNIYTQATLLGLSTDSMAEASQAAANYGKQLSGETLGSIAMFSELTGISEDSVGSFAAKLISSRRIEDVETKKLLTSILAVREQYGFANEDVGELLDITTKYANVIGATGEKVDSSTQSMAKFISTLKQAGLETSFATDLLDKMIDPERVKDNMLLLSKLGFSMEELNFGDPMANIEESLPKLKQLAQEITAIPSRLAASSIAEMYGFTLEEMRKVSETEFTQRDINREKTMSMYRQETQTAIETLGQYKNSLLGGISWGFNKIMGIFQPINDILGAPGILASSTVVIFSAVKLFKKLFGDALDNMANRFSLSFSNNLKKYIPNIEIPGVQEKSRASLTGKKPKLSEGISEGLLESEKRNQESMGIIEKYRKEAGNTNEDIIEKRKLMVEEATGKKLGLYQKEMYLRQKNKFSKSTKKEEDWKNDIASVLESSERRINQYSKNIAELEELNKNGAIEEKVYVSMSSAYNHLLANEQINFKNIISSASGREFQKEIYQNQITKLESLNIRSKELEQQKSMANASLDIAEKNLDITKYNEIQELIKSIEGQEVDVKGQISQLENNINQITSGSNVIESLEIEKRLKEKEKEKKLKELNLIELEKDLNLKESMGESTKNTSQKIEMLKQEISGIESEINKTKKERDDILGSSGVVTKTFLGSNSNMLLKNQGKIAEKSAKEMNNMAKNLALGLRADSSSMHRFFKRMMIDITSPFAKGSRGWTSSGTLGLLGGTLKGFLNPIWMTGISLSLGVITKSVKNNEKIQGSIQSLQKSSSSIMEHVSGIISNVISPPIDYIAEKLGMVAEKIEDKNSTISLEDKVLADMKIQKNQEGNLVIVMEKVLQEVKKVSENTGSLDKNTAASILGQINNVKK